MVSTLLIPGETLTATILDFWAFGETTGTALDSSVLGTCAVGRASKIRWRWRVKMEVRSDRIPSCKKIDLDFAGIGDCEGNGIVKRDGPAAAA